MLGIPPVAFGIPYSQKYACGCGDDSPVTMRIAQFRLKTSLVSKTTAANVILALWFKTTISYVVDKKEKQF